MANYSLSNTVTLASGSAVNTVVASAINASMPGIALNIPKTHPIVHSVVQAIKAVAQTTAPVGKFSFGVNGSPGLAGSGGVSVNVEWLA